MRLLTRSDFDGLVCGALLKAAGIIDSWTFVHPKDMQDGNIEVSENDVLANVPYIAGCGIWFDHHLSEIERVKDEGIPGARKTDPSCARVIFNYYKDSKPLSQFADLVSACDKVDSGALTKEEVLAPTGGVLLGFIMDPRTGLGRFRDFRISNLALMEDLLEKCAHMSVEEILELPDVKERIDCYEEQSRLFDAMLKEHTSIYKNVIVTDLRNVETIHAGNRFYIYSVYPEQNVSMWIVDGRNKQNVSIAIGYSVLNKTCNVNVGALCASHGGGGHKQVGTCQTDYATADTVIAEIRSLLSAN
ncbi:MAG: exopolyphosphatase [Spirochaetales bacterium]